MYIKKRKICLNCSWQNNSNQNICNCSTQSPKSNNKKCCQSFIIKNIPRNIFLKGENDEYIKHSQSNQHLNNKYLNIITQYNLSSSRNNINTTNKNIPPSCSKFLLFTTSTGANSFNKQNSNFNNKSKNNDNNIDEPTFKPLLNKRSLLMASKLPSFISRVSQENKKRKLKKMLIADYNNKFVYRNNSFTLKSNSPKSPSFTNNSLYQRGIEMINKRKEKIKEAKIEEEKNYLHFSYKPTINKTSAVFTKMKKGDIYQRGKIWKRKVDIKINKMKRNEFNKEIDKYKFTPQVNLFNINKIYKNRNRNILKENFNKSSYDFKGRNKYVKRSENSLIKKKDNLNNTFVEKSNLEQKSTFHKDFVIKRNINKNKKKHHKSQSMNDISPDNNLNKIRCELGIESFFEDC